MTQVDLDVVDLEIACEYIAVVGENIPAFRAYCVDTREFPTRAVVPCASFDDGGVEEFHHHQYAEENEEKAYQAVSEQDMFFIILFHRQRVRRVVAPGIRG